MAANGVDTLPEVPFEDDGGWEMTSKDDSRAVWPWSDADFIADAPRKQRRGPFDGPFNVELKRVDRHTLRNEDRHAKKRYRVVETPERDVTQQVEEEEEEEEEDEEDHDAEWWEKTALLIVREWSQPLLESHTVDGPPGSERLTVKKWSTPQVCRTYLQINSPALQTLLAGVIGSMSGVHFADHATKAMHIDLPLPKCIFHYRKEIRTAGRQLAKNSEAAKHFELFQYFMRDALAPTIAAYLECEERGLITYDLLWTLFRPGTIVFAMNGSKPHAFKVTGSAGHFDRVVSGRNGQSIGADSPEFRLEGYSVDLRGSTFVGRAAILGISRFAQAKPIHELEVFPIDYHPHVDKIKAELIARGRKFESFRSHCYCEYRGVAEELEMVKNKNWRNGDDASDEMKTSIKGPLRTEGRVMIDSVTYSEKHGQMFKRCATVESFRGFGDMFGGDSDGELDASNGPDILSDEECLIAGCKVPGFLFSERRWLMLQLDDIQPVRWNRGCFDALVLPQAQKDLVEALISRHSERDGVAEVEDVVKGKGKGLIFALHGPPGVGKTLMAECVSEITERPLYPISSGDLGTTGPDLDKSLKSILNLAERWKAVALIDEADIFLETRAPRDVERNTLVSVFLRLLEYYSGILILTTNRVTFFDEAFQSRIHCPLRFGDLPKQSRQQIWKNFLAPLIGDGSACLSEDDFDALSDTPLNGRQIKNTVSTSASLAKYKGTVLDVEQLEQVMQIQADFQADLSFKMDENLSTIKKPLRPRAGENVRGMFPGKAPKAHP